MNGGPGLWNALVSVLYQEREHVHMSVDVWPTTQSPASLRPPTSPCTQTATLGCRGFSEPNLGR